MARARPRSLRPPSDPAQGLNEAAALFAAGRLDEAARAYRAVERLAPDDFRATWSLAVIDIRQGRPAQARRRLEAVTARAPDHAPAWHNLGVVRQQLDDWEGAAAAYDRALVIGPVSPETRQALAVALTVLGRTAEALDHYRVLAHDPATRWAALTRIALIDPATIGDDELADMRRAAEDARVEVETRTGLWFALGEALERRGRDAEAFAAFAAGNRMKRGSFPAGAGPAEVAAAHAAALAQVQALFTPALLATQGGRGSASAAPIFIVGFPRSGSTLVEQILASHAGVQGLGETGVLPALVEARYPRGPRIAPARLKEIETDYLAAIKAHGWDGRRRFVDKTLENYLHVGLIHLVFPRAVILHSVRDPIDVGLSCYRQLFASGAETLYDLADIAAEYRRYRQAMDHWARVLPGRVVEAPHEALVADPEGEIRRLASAASLSWDPAMLRPEAREAAVATASASQVRRPISAASVQRWRRYAAELKPLIAALEGMA
jgi:tetratricopeptide (TPR) repeat protein